MIGWPKKKINFFPNSRGKHVTKLVYLTNVVLVVPHAHTI